MAFHAGTGFSESVSGLGTFQGGVGLSDSAGFGIFHGGTGLSESDLPNGFTGVTGLLVELSTFFSLSNARNGFIGFFTVSLSVFEISPFSCDRLLCALLMVLSIVATLDSLSIGTLGFNAVLGVIPGLFSSTGVDTIFFGTTGGLFMAGSCLSAKNAAGMFNLLFLLLVKLVDEDSFAFPRWVVVVTSQLLIVFPGCDLPTFPPKFLSS